MGAGMDAIERARDFSESKVSDLRKRLAAEVPQGANVVTCGSFARRDASASSDLDYFCIFSGGADTGRSNPQIQKIVDDVIGKAPSEGGAFAKNISEDDLLSNIGGWNDSNESITRRILYLLEGEYLTDQENFEKLRLSLISKYVRSTPDDHQIAFYLLNDIVRYWRTIAVDYAHKTSAGGSGKPWGVRNLKLVYSRKLIFASGIFSVALTADRSECEKCKVLDYLFSKTPIERMRYVCGDAATERLFQLYDRFLASMEDDDFRQRIDKLGSGEKKTDEEFRLLKNEGHYFSRELMGLLQKTFHASHPIHMSLIF
jgi:predicted nucleotidyltransferase